MDNKLKEDIDKIVDEVISSQMSNQQATLIFSLDDPDAERKLKKMLNVDNYYTVLHDFSQFIRNYLKYGDGEKVRFKSIDGYKEIVPDYKTMEYVREMFNGFLNENRIDLDD
ncbi:hypothetical protein [Massilibacteroides sp.]|uniref:hypothetical protein n=1 Tax=Massilibacteroides sp. TaxID=2034766 RepID=UPI002613A1BB|nr:hypothetical protein [Massilibacteroides sp.]MDD4516808.1 hypothetical protein [Massilibacteroides sp.]